MTCSLKNGAAPVRAGEQAQPMIRARSNPGGCARIWFRLVQIRSDQRSLGGAFRKVEVDRGQMTDPQHAMGQAARCACQGRGQTGRRHDGTDTAIHAGLALGGGLGGGLGASVVMGRRLSGVVEAGRNAGASMVLPALHRRRVCATVYWRHRRATAHAGRRQALERDGGEQQPDDERLEQIFHDPILASLAAAMENAGRSCCLRRRLWLRAVA